MADTSLDRYLFAQGTHRRVWQFLGPQPLADGGFVFRVWAPNAQRISVIGDWSHWHDHHPMYRLDGYTIWEVEVPAARPGQCYKLDVTGAHGERMMKADPMARRAELAPSTASILPDHPAHQWGDDEWRQQRGDARQRPLRIYEVHLGSWRGDLHNYRDIAHPLALHVKHLGFTHVELMPISEYPYGPSWGYQVTGYFAPTSRYGTPDDLRYLVDVMHAHGIGVILDWVPAHFPRDSWALARFDGTPLYEHADPRRGEHPDWGTLIFDYGSPEVRNFLIGSALYWMDEFHIDGLRVDAVASMLYLDYSRGPDGWTPNVHGGRENLEAIEFFRQLTTTVAAEQPGALMIAEESTAWPGVTHPVDQGGLGFSHKWNMGWMHDTLSYLAEPIEHRPEHHHRLTFGLSYAFAEQYVLPLSHDEVVHGKGSLVGKMTGDAWQRFAGLRALYGWMWALPGAPLVFMGAEIAPWEEWSETRGLPWHLLDSPEHRGVFDLLTRLNQLTEQWPALWERDRDPGGFQWLDANNAEQSVYAFLRWSHHGWSAVACITNLTPRPHGAQRVGVPWSGAWQVLVDTDARHFGGSGFGRQDTDVEAVDVGWHGQPHSVVVDIPPMSTMWLGAQRPAS